ncbi:hypothetical protein O181_102080 [Austropuccinia psidii MF-1]|uniref:Uncharacterized protein n=1 Tax=Austropuccinia psidii MF-1 TaxID=1389203 RepID=A0A9Q3JFM2_9BASI|nr:hypothetical protein [Austropuccinia psidii MF-1]
MLSQHILLDEHQSANTQINMGQSEEIANELTKNKFCLISAIKIATSWTVAMDDETSFAEHWKKFRLSNQHLFPKQKSKPLIVLLIIFPNSSNVGAQNKPQPHGVMST